jgi:hypothetical protein
MGQCKDEADTGIAQRGPGNLPRVALKSDLRRAGSQAEGMGTGLGGRYVV